MFPQVRPPDGCRWQRSCVCCRGRLGARTHSEGLMGCNFKLRKLSCRCVACFPLFLMPPIGSLEPSGILFG